MHKLRAEALSPVHPLFFDAPDCVDA